MKYAIIRKGSIEVENVVKIDGESGQDYLLSIASQYQAVDVTNLNVSPGDLYENGEFTKPPPPEE